MKNRVIAIILTAIMLVGAMTAASALDAPAPGGDHIFNAERIMKFDDGTRFHNGIVNGGIINPGTGAVSTYAGVKFDLDTYKGEKCVKVELLDEKVTGLFDFNYYQWNAEYYNPSLDAAKYPWLRVRYAYNDAAADIDCMKFMASVDTVLGSTIEGATKTWDIANGKGEWMDTVVYVGDLIFGDGTTWSENTIRQFRIQMFEYNEDPDAVCYIAGFGFFETEEAAKSYDFASGTASTGTDDAAAAEKAAAEKAAAEKAAAEKAAAEKAAAEKAAAEKAAAEAAAKAAEAAKKAEEAAAAAAAEDASEEVKAAAEAAKAEAEAAAAAAKAAEDTANAAAAAAQTPAAAQTSDYTVVAVIASVAALAAFVVAKKKFSL